ncbi:two-component system, chemotaxis family, response regulator CheB [Duganella sp. CF402]|uniref:chemotaxis protein CheB n=1 Tax=unclassified Duganella TaxID=2636909 RepID=UPI0008B0846C|nr:MULTISPECIES: chemotaxis protein CheB [unclassified Duganella]RZT05772.1 two-component system chemotaxis response regulator CheB [Duganella sp. BK701]SEM91771.1 two-component system, chemotaxis family, response regulator CheB [Duganella sp. CF402]
MQKSETSCKPPAVVGVVTARMIAALAGRAIDVVVIGASAGGVAALLHVLTGLPADYQHAIVVVMHIPAGRKSQLADVFQRRMQFPVREACDKEQVLSGTLYFAGSGHHLLVDSDRHFSLSSAAPVHFSRPSIDSLMLSAAAAYGPALLGIVLTGANRDGATGLAAIGAAGGLTVVQEPDEAEQSAMPLEAIARRAPDLILSLADIHALLLMLPPA